MPRPLVVPARRAVREEQDGAGDEREAHEHLKDQDFHEVFFPSSERTSPIETSDESGMITAAQSGDIRPAYESPSAMEL